MSGDATLTDLSIHVREREVLRGLGYPGSRRPSARAERALERLMPVAVALARARGAYRMITEEEAGACGVPRPTSLVGVGLCTIGPALEEEACRSAERGDLLDAMVLDAFGSAAAEAAAEALDLHLRAEARSRGLGTRARISPGYGRWDLQRQVALLELLPAETLGVRLTEGMMMVPRKSVSFAVRFESRTATELEEPERCSQCGLEECAHRIETGTER